MDEKVKNTINEIIDKLHFRTFPKVWESVKREIPTIKKEEKHYVLEAKDGTTIIKPRFQLIVCETNGSLRGVLKEKYKWGDSLQGGIPRFPQKFI